MPYHHAIPDVCSVFWITRGQFNNAIVADKCNDIPALQVFVIFGRCLGSSQAKCSSAEWDTYFVAGVQEKDYIWIACMWLLKKKQYVLVEGKWKALLTEIDYLAIAHPLNFS